MHGQEAARWASGLASLARQFCATLLACIALAFLAGPAPVHAQSEVGAGKGIDQVIEAARKAGVSIVVVEGGDKAEPGVPAEMPLLSERAARWADDISENLRQIGADIVAAPTTVPEHIAAMSPEGGIAWPAVALVVVAIALAIGALAEQALKRRVTSGWLGRQPSPDLARSDRVRRVLLGAVVEALLLAGGLALAMLIAALLIGRGPGRMVMLSVFDAVVIVRFLLLFARTFLVPAPGLQILELSAGTGTEIYSRLRVRVWVVGAFAAVALWLSRIGASDGVVDLWAILVSLGTAAILSSAARSIRLATAGERAGKSWLMREWDRVAIAYFFGAALATILGRLAGADTGGIVVAPVIAAMVAAVLYALSLLVVDAVFPERPAEEGLRLPSYRDWAERSARVIVGTVALGVVLGAWGLAVFDDNGDMQPLYTILLMSVVAYVGWSAIHTAFDRRMALERVTHGPDTEEMEEGGPGGTRLSTLLPLFRNAVLIAILVLVVMVVLSAIGVDIAPLFAGAGIIGFAVGFGAQALVKDIFSGIFFLIDDAFRVGEYIDAGSAKGTVEKISIRSMQLRHQNGPLHTIPFGEIKTLTNFSRDWVIMKLPIRVRFGTDTERVRKLIKKLGQELLEHPQVGAKFVEPLKSQGVYQMDEMGIVTRVKFKTKPGDQFVVRKVVLQKINELFEHEGINFGGREVIVRTSGGDADQAALEAGGAAAAAMARRGQGSGGAG